MLAKVAADHDQIEQSMATLRAQPEHAARHLDDLGRMLADHYEFVAGREPAQWIVDVERAVTIEEDCAEVATMFERAQGVDPRSLSATQAVGELLAAIRRHIDAEEATLYAEGAGKRAPSAQEATPTRFPS